MSEILAAYQSIYAEFKAAKAALEDARAEGRDDAAERERYKAALAAKNAAWHAVLIEASRGEYFRAVDVDSGANLGFLLARADGEPEEAVLFAALPDGATNEIGIVHMSAASGVTYKITRHEPPAPIRAIIVGRHAGEIPGVEVIEQRNIEWALDYDECARQWRALADSAIKANAAIVLQNVPGILAAVLVGLAANEAVSAAVYVVISKPGPRLAGVGRDFDIPAEHHEAASAAVQHANGRAIIESAGDSLRVTVDPVSPFKFVRLQRVW